VLDVMATTAELLAQAKEAYHRLMLGESVVEVRDQSGESIRYQAATASRLLAYIRTMDPTFGLTCGGAPMRFVG
jgi:hypothetical protein